MVLHRHRASPPIKPETLRKEGPMFRMNTLPAPSKGAFFLPAPELALRELAPGTTLLLARRPGLPGSPENSARATMPLHFRSGGPSSP